ncbi:orf145 (mitochondrion) [Beta vulgaris subsp. vulgaris]|uniref:Orf145 protein n=1 Tax=Beta vulgaris subsp. vulgaris TaxID=3555 RepID=Q9MFB3_BETVV|nr:orf145 [Beta vulgaris subsp. vulgaris]BAA99337.1 orf145 [Beta vulgaris subsp. vulgaris]
MSQERGEQEAPTARGTPREPAYRDEAFWRSQVNFGPPNPATDEKALWNKGKRVRCHTPCLPKVPRGRARRSRATTRERIPHRQGTGDGHLKAHHDLQATPARPGKATRLGVRGSIVPAAFQTSYSSFLKAGGRDLFSATEKEEQI